MSLPMAIQQGHIDGAATEQMLLKQHQRRLHCHSDHLHSHAVLSTGFSFQHGVSCSCSGVIIAKKCTILS